jgi:hypothetical protein
MVTLADPVELNFNVCEAGLFSDVLPNAMLVALIASAAVPGFNCNDSFWEIPPPVAVKVTDREVATALTLAVNVALAAEAGTVIELGTLTAELLLARVTLKPLAGAGAERLTVHVSASVPAMEVLLQERPLKAAAMAGEEVAPS